MNYYPFHIGDYASATQHLTLEEDAMYRRLLDITYTTEKPLTKDERQLFRLARASTEAHREALTTVLHEFFEETEDGWVSGRAMVEIDAMREKQQKQRDRANKRWHKPSVVPVNAAALPQHEESHATALKVDAVAMPPTPTPTPTPTPKEEEKKAPRKRDASHSGVLRPDDVPEQTWTDFLAIRKVKRAPLTATALAGIASQAAEARMTLADALAMCCIRGWQSFKAEWAAECRQSPQPKPSESFAERDERMRQRRWEEMTGRKWPGASDHNVIDMPAEPILEIAI